MYNIRCEGESRRGYHGVLCYLTRLHRFTAPPLTIGILTMSILHTTMTQTQNEENIFIISFSSYIGKYLDFFLDVSRRWMGGGISWGSSEFGPKLRKNTPWTFRSVTLRLQAFLWQCFQIGPSFSPSVRHSQSTAPKCLHYSTLWKPYFS